MKKTIKALLVALGTVLLFVYAFPLIAGILNIGNLFGMAVGTIFILIGLFLEKALKLHKGIIAAFCIVAMVGSCLFLTTLSSIIKETDVKEEQQGTLIVLGCKVRGEEPSLQLYKRTMVGVDYLKANPNEVVILCGGKGSDEKISEAECMKYIMLKNDIDEGRIFIEDKSTSTEENIKFAKEIIDENNLGNEIVIATSDYHCYRANLIAKNNGLNPKALPAYADRFSRPTFYTREVFGVWLQYLK